MENDNIKNAIGEALAAGFSNSVELKVETLQFLPEVREMCTSNRCHKYDKCWTCPPACGSLEECASKVTNYSRGIIVQSVGELEDSFDYEGMMALESQHKENFEKLVAELHKKHPNLLAMGAGGCSICEECAYPDGPCRFPDRAIPSMEASGLWVSDICKKNNIPYNYGTGKMAYTSCILIE
jgi:predicted metal-binding protein